MEEVERDARAHSRTQRRGPSSARCNSSGGALCPRPLARTQLHCTPLRCVRKKRTQEVRGGREQTADAPATEPTVIARRSREHAAPTGRIHHWDACAKQPRTCYELLKQWSVRTFSWVSLHFPAVFLCHLWIFKSEGWVFWNFFYECRVLSTLSLLVQGELDILGLGDNRFEFYEVFYIRNIVLVYFIPLRAVNKNGIG